MLSLYEAAHLGVDGEEVLDESLAFTTAHLKLVTTTANSPIVKQVMHALEQPFHKGMIRKDETHNEVLLKLAKLDFNRLQSLHLKELSQVSRWWKDLDFASKLPYARDRVVECYFLMIGVYPEPQFSFGPMILTKVIAMISVIDDTYDAYGTLEELQLFTDAIERWDIGEIDQLPEYMKVVYLALLGVYNEIEEQMKKEGRSYCVFYTKEEMKNLVRAYFVEAKWFSKGHIPTFEEYMENAIVGATHSILAVTSFVGMGEIATKEAMEWMSNMPNIVKSSCIISRIMDDIVTNEFEQQRGHVCSGSECYMKQYGMSRQEVTEEFHKKITDGWKDMNKECLRRVIDVVYKHEDGYTNAHKVLKDHIISLIVDPIPI
uniref:(-)-germacrene D synthase-like n=1 Tax=Nelumbo nucifera TaxID=4432 RepID=A0A822ZZ81_NELNU|nr:TPA_asm: hypothetical protein HUJ06_018073 [Nelumbo nucifera]